MSRWDFIIKGRSHKLHHMQVMPARMVFRQERPRDVHSVSQRQVQQERRCDYVPELLCRLRSVVALGGNKLPGMHSRNLLQLKRPDLVHQVWSRYA
jgi:hypothetical protein